MLADIYLNDYHPTATELTTLKKKEALEKSAEVDISRKQIVIESAEAEESLALALPELENARKALAYLDKSDITEIRAFASPPEAVQNVCECVAILKGFKDISWKTAKLMMAEGNFLKSLQEMDCDRITTKQVASVRNHMKVNNIWGKLWRKVFLMNLCVFCCRKWPNWTK